MFDDPIEDDEDIESKELDAHSDGLEMPAMEQIANSSPIAKESAAMRMKESKVMDDNGCDQR